MASSSMASFHSLSSHSQLSPSPFSRLPQFNPAYRYTYTSSPNPNLSLSPRQTNSIPRPLSLSPLINSTFIVKASYNPMLPPYNVLITGSTKGHFFTLSILIVISVNCILLFINNIQMNYVMFSLWFRNRVCTCKGVSKIG